MLLQKIERETYTEVLRPRMLSGHQQGRILSMLAKMIRPRLIVEVGTYTGYSALCMAEGLAPDGKIITIDVNEELVRRTQGYFNESPFADQIDYRTGLAAGILPDIAGPVDMVFIDADKANYKLYYDLVIDKMSKGGIIIADNVLWSGKVLEEISDDEDTEALKRFNRDIHGDPRVENLMLPVRDGLSLIRVI